MAFRIPFPCVHRKSETVKRLEPFSVNGVPLRPIALLTTGSKLVIASVSHSDFEKVKSHVLLNMKMTLNAHYRTADTYNMAAWLNAEFSATSQLNIHPVYYST